MSTQPINKQLSCLGAVKRNQCNNRPPIRSVAFVYSCRDRSGSMSSYGSATAQSLYDSIQDHKKNSTDNNVNVIYSLTTFDTKAEHPYISTDIHDISMTLEEAQEHVKPRNLTRLYATAMEELAKLRRDVKAEKRTNPNVVGVFELHTDGQDNKSKPFTSMDLNSAVTAARNEGITCIFAGANQDAVTIGEQYGFDRDLSLTTDSTTQNASTGLRMASQAVMRACSGARPQFTQTMRQISAPGYSSYDTASGAALLAMSNSPPPTSLRSTATMMPPPLTRQTN